MRMFRQAVFERLLPANGYEELLALPVGSVELVEEPPAFCNEARKTSTEFVLLVALVPEVASVEPEPEPPPW